MATMISEVYNAFRSVGIAEDKARAAAEAIATESVATKSDISGLKFELQELRADQRLIKWMIGLVILVEIIPYLKAVL